MHIFPFDTQSCPIILESFHYKEDDMMMHVLPVQAVQRRQYDGKWQSMSRDVQLKEWKPQGSQQSAPCDRVSPGTGIDAAVNPYHYEFEDRVYSRATVLLHMSREPSYYFSKILFMVPSCL